MKQSEINNLSDSELHEELEKHTTSYAELKSAHVVSALENPSQLKQIRRTIARLKTELSKREDK